MQIDVEKWMEELVSRLHRALPGRLRFIGLQGSYRRGEATPQSDIDVVAVLDRVDLAALDSYRQTVLNMPHGELACGFLCDEDALRRWPKFDLLSLVMDTQPYWGELEPLLPAFTPADTDAAVKIGASALYHAAVHCYLYDEAPEAALSALSKSVFFLLRARVYRDTGIQCLTRAQLADTAAPDEAALLSLVSQASCRDETELAYARLISWAAKLLE